MKRTLSLVLTVVMVIGIFTGVPVTVSAASVSNLTFTLNEYGVSYSVTDCSEPACGEIVIPDTYNGKPVTSIGDWAFSGCTSLESITIPDSVISIGDYVFEYCDSLTSVTIGEGVTSIGDYAFRGCKSLTSITIPDGVTDIGDYAFEDCKKLTSATIGNSVTNVGDYVFFCCDNLTSITIGNSVTRIGIAAFSECDCLKEINVGMANTTYSSLDGVLYNKNRTELIFYPKAKLDNSFTIPNSVTNISERAFCNCDSLTSVIIPNSVTSIGEDAFYECSGLTSITIPDSVTSIGRSAFQDCTNLTSVYITDIGKWCNIDFGLSCDGLSEAYSNPLQYADNLYINGELVKDVIIPNGVTKIPECCFWGTSLTSVTIPDSVTSIGAYAFFNCDSLTSVSIGKRVKSIGDEAFSWCTSLTSITIPDSVTSIGDAVFQNCTKITSVTIPDSINSIGQNAFYNTAFYNDTSNWEDGVIYIGNHLIKANGTISGEYSIKLGTNTIADDAFRYRESLTSITIPDSVTSIGTGAFLGCTSLTSITIPDSVTSIGDSAFSDCTSLTSVTISDSVTRIGTSAFSWCASLTSIIIPGGVTSIGRGAFRCCTSLTSVTIPDSITSIGNDAFYECESLTSVIIPDSVTSIGDGTFYDCYSLTSITIPDSVTSIGDSAFAGCISLISITIPDSVTNIGSYAFYNTGYYNNENNWDSGVLYIGNHLIAANKITIGKEAYVYVGNISGDYVVKFGTRTIADDAFYNCTNLISITIPDSVTSIGCLAFYNCVGLESITIPDSVTRIGDFAFWCAWLSYVFFTGTEEEWSKISVGEDNTCLTNAAIHYESTDHTASDWIIKEEPECMLYGCRYKECAVCKKVLASEDISPIGHIESDWLIDINATCITTGSKHKECTVCGDIIETETILPTGHSYGDWVVTKEATCTETGANNKTCTACGDVVTEAIDALGHNYSTEWTVDEAPTCTEEGIKSHHCTRCDDKADVTVIEVAGHSYGEWNVIKEATCTESGTKTKTCTVCGNVVTEAIEAKGHTTVIDEAVAPTCTTDGKTEGSHCSECDVVFEEQEAIPATGHIESDWIIDEEAIVNAAGSKHKECDVCGDTLETEVISQLKCAKPSISKIENKDYGVRFEWKAVSGADSYKVYRKVSGGSYKLLGTTTKTAYADKTAKSGTKYFYVVKAVNEAGSSEKSASKGIIFLAMPKISSIANKSGGVKIVWGKVTGAEKYKVYCKTGSGSYKYIGKSTRTSYTDKTAKSGTKYTYVVKAVKDSYVSEKSASKSITFLSAPTIKTPTTAKAGITVKWSKVSGAEGYIVYRKTGSGSYERLAKIKGGTKVSYLDKSSKKGKTYSYKVYAYKGGTKSAASAVKTIKDKY